MQSPLNNLAISFSGGGFRATAYNLGVLSYLNQLQFNNDSLLKNVVMISTISGGTITGVKYAACLTQGKTFEQFYKELYDFLQKDIIMDEAFKILNTPDNWQYKTKSKNLINAVSEIYQKQLLDDSNFGSVLDYTTKTGVEFMFNATDLENAKPFRFQTQGKIGNFEHFVSPDYARNFRLGDIIAASSCFPGGFEPLIFPDDFINTDSKLGIELPKKINIQDGGIVDNQGIESIWLAEKRKTKDNNNFIGTYIISDVARKETNTVETEKPKNGLLNWLGGFSLNTYYYVAFFILLLSIGLLIFDSSKWLIFFASILFSFSAFNVILFNLLRIKIVSLLKKTLHQKAPRFLSDFNLINKISLNEFYKLIDVRISSILKLNQTVFLARLRQLHYDMTFDDIKWNLRTVANLIYELPKHQNIISTELSTHIDNANKMDTALWFSDEEKINNLMLNDLILCGQATICFTLKVYLEKRLMDTINPISEEFLPNIKIVIAQLTDDFTKFNTEPNWLLDKYNKV